MATWQEFAAGYGDIPAIGSLSGVHNSKLFDTMLRQIASRIGYTGKTSIPGTYQFENVNEGGTFMDTAQGTQASPEFLKALEAYQFQKTSPTQGQITNSAGQNVGTFTAGNKDTGFDKLAEVAIPVALTAIGGQLAGGLLSGAAGGGSLTGPGALDAYAAMDAAYGTAGVGGAGGLGGAAGGLLDGLPAITANPLPAIESYVSANPVTVPDLMSGVPEIAAPAASSVPSVFNAAADSQTYNQAAGVTGSQAASAATVPTTVNLANAGGTMATAGGLQGAANTAAQAIRDATAGSAIEGGGLLSKAGSTVGNAVQSAGSGLGAMAQWMKDNPAIGKLLLGGVTSLLSASGGGSENPQTPSGPPVKWNSPLQQGLLSDVKQYAPAAITQNKPAGLLAQGYANDGAWRYLRG